MGPFFAVTVHDHDAVPRGSWRPMAELLPGDADRPSEALDARVLAVGTALVPPPAGLPTPSPDRPPPDGHAGEGPPELALVEPRVAASVTHLGLVARVIAPAVAVAALGGSRVRLDPGSLWWQPQLGGPFPLSVALGEASGLGLGGSLVEASGLGLGGSLVERLTEEMATRYHVSRRVLWGNVGSAANSAAGLVATAHPDLGPAAAHAADMVLSDPRVDGGALRAVPRFRRRSCCLIYRVTGGTAAVCGDCVLGA